MDNQLEQKIRERAYELWMRDGCIPDRANEYWFQAEREVMGEAGSQPAGKVGAEGVGGDQSSDVSDVGMSLEGVPSEAGLATSQGGLGISGAPSQTPDEAMSSPLGAAGGPAEDVPQNPAGTKTRRKRTAVPPVSSDGGASGATSRRRRSV